MNEDELRDRLRAADPARHLTHFTTLHHEARELTEAPTMNTSPSGRTRLVLAAAAVAIVGAAGVGLVLGNDEDPVAKSPETTPTKALTTATYTLGTQSPTARCIVPDVNTIREVDVAFRAKVTARDGDQIELTPSTYYTGPTSDRVVLDVQHAEGAISEALPVDFIVGKEYIVAIEQDTVRLCGFTAEVQPGTDALYKKALG